MKNSKFPLPKKYWVYISIMAFAGIMWFVNIFLSNVITGDKEFSEYGKGDWIYVAFFIISEIVIGFLLFFFSVKAGKIGQKNEKQKEIYYEQFKYDGIKPGDYDYVWFNLCEDERAKILKQGNAFLLYVEAFDVRSESWNAVNTVSCYESIDDVKRALFYDFDFYCDENDAVFYEHEDEEFKS